MAIWEFVVTGRMFVSAHCEQDALQSVEDAASECLSSLESVELVSGPARLHAVTD